MLNRRYLRIKVYHALYAYSQTEGDGADRIGKELVNGIGRVLELYLSLLLVFGELRHTALLRIEERRKKRMPSPADLQPNTRFVDNPVMNALAGSERLGIECAKYRVSWTGNHELFSKLVREIEASEEYKAYMDDPEPGFRKDQGFLSRLFADRIANHEPLQDVYESRSIHWMEDLDLAATMVKRTIEQLRESDGGELPLGELDLDLTIERDFVTRLYRKTIELDEEHEAAIAAKASNWESDRIASSDMILMKMALTEARVFDEIPVKVTLNEYIEIAKVYSTPKSKNFINGVLDKLFIDMKADGRIRKVGRGLLES